MSRSLPLLFASLLLPIAPAAVGQVQAGDLAVVGYYGDNPDAVAFVALAAVPGGTEIALTDNGWRASGGFRANEGTLRYTVPAGGLAAGTVVRVDEPAGLAFSASGDQVLLYTGPDAAPQFVYGLNNEGDGVWQDDAADSNTSALPTGLVNGSTAIALFERDNAAYVGPTTGTRAELLVLISGRDNWATSDDERPPFPTSFEVDGGGGNLPPVFVTVLPDTQIVAGETLVFDYDAVDPDGDALTYSLPPGAEDFLGASLDPATGVLTWPTLPLLHAGNTYDFVIYVSDDGPGGVPDDSTVAVISVLEEQPNRPPVLSGPRGYGLIGVAGATFISPHPALDVDGDPVTYRIVSGPEGAVYTNTGLFQWTAPDSAGVFEFVLEASDGQATARRSFFIGAQRELFDTPAQGPTRAAIRERFSPDQTLGYGPGRDTLYARVEAFPNGVVEGIYTGYRVALAEGVDPSVYLFERGINAEHTWPQSLGAGDEPQRSDLHILYPARENVNTSRGNDPYAEIPDEQTQTWYRRAEQQSGIPSDSVGTWSEAASGRFEPREAVKGDVARAALYFAAVYESAADAGFLAEQLETLLAWDAEDPVSVEEVVRSGLIQRYQGNVNPFVLDPGLAFRAFDGVISAAEPGSEGAGLALSALWPNPARGAVRMTLTAGAAGPVRVEAFDVLGRRVAVLHDGRLVAGQRVPLVLEVGRLAPGAYVVRATGDGVAVMRRVSVAR